MKRSSQVALLLMGTVAVGGGAYELMPSENCPPNQPGLAGSPQATQCSPRSSSSSGGGYRGGYGYGFTSSSSTTAPARQGFVGGVASSGSSAVQGGSAPIARGGFGSFASHFSGGG